jgi:hypothetical protein
MGMASIFHADSRPLLSKFQAQSRRPQRRPAEFRRATPQSSGFAAEPYHQLALTQKSGSGRTYLDKI